MDEAARATEEGDFQRRAQVHLGFHRILARMTGNPIMVIVMDGLLTVLAQFIQTIGEYENTFVLPSRKRFLKHLEEGNTEAAVAEMETSLRRLQRGYLSRVSTAAPSAAPGAPAARKRAPVARKTAS
jgi:DNA-binding GntR family transcriptional regulator